MEIRTKNVFYFLKTLQQLKSHHLEFTKKKRKKIANFTPYKYEKKLKL